MVLIAQLPDGLGDLFLPVRSGDCRVVRPAGAASVAATTVHSIAGAGIEVDPVWWSPSGFSEEASQMPKTRPPYAPEFRRQMVELVRAGRDPAELAREFEPTAQSISHWVAQADRQEGRREEKGNGLSAAEREELARLRRENKQLRLERDILSRAAAWFARETGAIPPGSSNS
jgi:transposase